MYSTSGLQSSDAYPAVCESYSFNVSTSTPKQTERNDSGYFSARQLKSPSSVKKNLSLHFDTSYSINSLDQKCGGGDHSHDYKGNNLSYDAESLPIEKCLKIDDSLAYSTFATNSDAGYWYRPCNNELLLSSKKKTLSFDQSMEQSFPCLLNKELQNVTSPGFELKSTSFQSAGKPNGANNRSITELSSSLTSQQKDNLKLTGLQYCKSPPFESAEQDGMEYLTAHSPKHRQSSSYCCSINCIKTPEGKRHNYTDELNSDFQTSQPNCNNNYKKRKISNRDKLNNSLVMLQSTHLQESHESSPKKFSSHFIMPTSDCKPNKEIQSHDNHYDVNITNKVFPRVNSQSSFHNLQKTTVPFCGQHIGEKFVDFLKEFSIKRNCMNVLSIILSNVSPKTLCVMSWVNRAWRKVCLTHPYANQQRLRYLEQQRCMALKLGKENWHCKQKESPVLAQERNPFEQMQNVLDANEMENGRFSRENITVFSSPSKSRYQCFVEEAKKLKPGERLQPCPQCRSPSHVNDTQHRGHCTRPSCAYDFCILCFSLYHENKSCPSIGKGVAKRNTIGSKSSRRNLRRL